MAVASTVWDVDAVALERLQPADGQLFADGRELDVFARLRREHPVHRTDESRYGAYWSVTRAADIQAVDGDHETFSSHPAIHVADADPDFPLPMFIAMDPPRHDAQRMAVSPVASREALARLEPVIRARAGAILDALPVGEAFDWVDAVSTELTTMTLATLLGFPQAERRRLARWSDVATAEPGGMLVTDAATRRRELAECAAAFEALIAERAAAAEGDDLLFLLSHAEATRDMDRTDLLGAILLLIVGGSDTSRNVITGGVLALHEHPDQFARVDADRALIPALVSESVRWQTPAAHMRRVARREVELGGKRIRRGDKVVMWYVSGNRDALAIPEPDRFWIERPQVRRHLSFGSGVHRCLGARLAEMQVRVLWEEALARFARIEVVGAPVRTASCFVRGFQSLPVQVTRR